MDSCLNVGIFPLNMKVPIRPVRPLKCMCTVVYSTSLPYLHQHSLESVSWLKWGKYVALHGYRTFACLDDSARAICLSASSLTEGTFLSNKPTNHLIALISSANFRSSICVSTLFLNIILIGPLGVIFRLCVIDIFKSAILRNNRPVLSGESCRAAHSLRLHAGQTGSGCPL